VRVRQVVVLGIGLVSVAWAPSAFGGPAATTSSSTVALQRQLGQLTRRVNALETAAKLDQLESVETSVQSTVGVQDGSTRIASATVLCPSGSQAAGGGAEFSAPEVGDVVSYSAPYMASGQNDGWEASARAASSGSGLLKVYAVCVQHRSF
jgi:hypothetical protein